MNCIADIIIFIYLFYFIDRFIVPKKGRWFILHTIGNFFTACYTAPIVYHVLTDPIKSFNEEPNYRPLNLTMALHIYHTLFFNNLTTIDWIHHIVMCTVAGCSYFYKVGQCTNFIIFFINGLPGGLDYFMLALVKHNKLNYLKEKELNSYINIWIRSPGIIIGAYNLYLANLYGILQTGIIEGLIILGSLLWNAQYFTYRVVANYHKKLCITGKTYLNNVTPLQPNDND